MRIRASREPRPTSLAKILLPPLGMSTGFFMFVVPEVRIPLVYAAVAFPSGLLLSYPLIATTRLKIVDGQVYVEQSKSFALILMGLLALRLALHTYIEQFITVQQTAGLFFVLAFGMISSWRVAMWVRFRKLTLQRPGN